MFDSVARLTQRARLAILFTVALVAIFTLTLSFYRAPASEKLRVVFFDIGQGDAIFIESPTGAQVLVDAGPGRRVVRRLSRELGFWDRTIDMVVMTHEDADHAGGMSEVFRRYEVGTFVRTENQGESFVADAVDNFQVTEGSEIINARRGMAFDLGGGTLLTVLFPNHDPTMLDSNTSSIVARLTYGETEFLLTGDSPTNIEEYLVSLDPSVLKSDVLKLGHHGSRTSSSAVFLDAVHPEYAIVSAGKDNRYGHPHKEVTDLLKERNIPFLNTAEEGSIAFESDGVTLTRVR